MHKAVRHTITKLFYAYRITLSVYFHIGTEKHDKLMIPRYPLHHKVQEEGEIHLHFSGTLKMQSSFS